MPSRHKNVSSGCFPYLVKQIGHSFWSWMNCGMDVNICDAAALDSIFDYVFFMVGVYHGHFYKIVVLVILGKNVKKTKKIQTLNHYPLTLQHAVRCLSDCCRFNICTTQGTCSYTWISAMWTVSPCVWKKVHFAFCDRCITNRYWTNYKDVSRSLSYRIVWKIFYVVTIAIFISL